MFATIDISSTTIIFNSDKVNLNCVFFFGQTSPDSLGIDKAVCIVVPLILGTLSSFVEDENEQNYDVACSRTLGREHRFWREN